MNGLSEFFSREMQNAATALSTIPEALGNLLKTENSTTSSQNPPQIIYTENNNTQVSTNDPKISTALTELVPISNPITVFRDWGRSFLRKSK